MTKMRKLQCIYQTDLDSQFIDGSSIIQASKLSSTHTPALVQIFHKLDATAQQMIAYWKLVLRSNFYFSLPAELFNSWMALGTKPTQLGPGESRVEWDAVLLQCSKDLAMVADMLDDIILFRVVNCLAEDSLQLYPL